MTDLYALATAEKIDVIHDDIPINHIKALFCEDHDGSTTIVLDKSLANRPSIERCVFAEELGHYFTAQGSAMTKSHKTEKDRLQIRRNEHRAVRWAVKKLIPLEQFLAAYTNGIEEAWELAEHFGVTEEYICLRFNVFALTGR